MPGPSNDHGDRDPDALRARAGVSGNPNADQHFLVDDRVLDRLPGYATEAGFDCSAVLEIGGGTGALTDRLLVAAETVTARAALSWDRLRRVVDADVSTVRHE